MWSWFVENGSGVSALTSCLMLIVWGLYLHLFYSSYRNQLRAKILINRGAGHNVSSRCIVTNMSSQTVYVEAIIVAVRARSKEHICSLSDLDRLAEPSGDERRDLFQGPLASGEYLDIGTFGDLFELALQHEPEASQDVTSANIIVAGRYTLHEQVVAAQRAFEIAPFPDYKELRPKGPTRQFRTKRELKAVEETMAEHSAGDASIVRDALHENHPRRSEA